MRERNVLQTATELLVLIPVVYEHRIKITTSRQIVDLVPIFHFHSFILQVKETFTENFEQRKPDEDHQKEDYQDEFTKKLCRKLMEFV